MNVTLVAASLILALLLPSPIFPQKLRSARAVTPRGSSSPNQGLIGLVDNSDYRYRDGCGCSLFPSSRGRNLRHHYYFLTETGNALGKTAWMNVDGTTVRFSLLSTTKPSGRERKGGKFTEVYRGGGITARTGYAATITVPQGDRNQTVRAAGDCGC